MGLIKCTLQPRVPVFNHSVVQMDSHDPAGIRALLEWSFGTKFFSFFVVLKLNYIVLKNEK